MNIKQSIEYIKTHGIATEKTDTGYKITNSQGVSLKVTDKAIINYAKQLQYNDKMKRLNQYY